MRTTARRGSALAQVGLDHRHPALPLVLGDLGVPVAGEVGEPDPGHLPCTGGLDLQLEELQRPGAPGRVGDAGQPGLPGERVQHRGLPHVAAPHEGELGHVGRRGPVRPVHGGTEEVCAKHAKGHGATIMPHGPANPPPRGASDPPRPSRDGARPLLAGDHPGSEHPGRRGGPLRRAVHQGEARGAHRARLQGGPGHRRHPPGPVPGGGGRAGGRDQRLPVVPAREGRGPRHLREGPAQDLHRRLPDRLALPRDRRGGLLREGRRGRGHPLPGGRPIGPPRPGRAGEFRGARSRTGRTAPAAPAGR